MVARVQRRGSRWGRPLLAGSGRRADWQRLESFLRPCQSVHGEAAWHRGEADEGRREASYISMLPKAVGPLIVFPQPLLGRIHGYHVMLRSKHVGRAGPVKAPPSRLRVVKGMEGEGGKTAGGGGSRGRDSAASQRDGKPM